jgi:hypothetical protein
VVRLERLGLADGSLAWVLAVSGKVPDHIGILLVGITSIFRDN